MHSQADVDEDKHENTHTHTRARAHTHIEVNYRKESDRMEKNWKNKVILSDEIIVKESRRYNVLVWINHHQDFSKDDTYVTW